MPLAISLSCPPRESVMLEPLTTPSSLARLRACLVIGCGAGLLLYTGAVLRRRLVRPRSPPRVTCPIADNTIALLQELHDGPFRFGDPTPFAMAARAEATRRIRRQQRERRRLRRRMQSKLCHPKNSQRLKSRCTTAAAGTPSTLVIHAVESTSHLGHYVPGNKGTRSDADMATSEKDRGTRAAAPTLSRRGCTALPSAYSTASFGVPDSVDDDDHRHRVKKVSDGGVHDTNGQLVAKGAGGCKMTPSEASLLPSSSMGSTYRSDYSYSRSSSTSTTSGSSYNSRISTSSLTESTASSPSSRGSASSLLAMTTISGASPDSLPWQRTTFDGASLGGGGGLHSSNHAPPQLQQCSPHHSSRSPKNEPTRSYSNLSQHMMSGSSSIPYSSSYPHSMTGAMGGLGIRYPAQQLWSGVSSPAVATHQASSVSPQPVAMTASSSALGCCDASLSPETAYMAASASVPGAPPSLPVSGRGGGGEDEETHWNTVTALMYGPPLFATEMDVTDALAELRSSVCFNGSRQGSSCLIGGASSTAHTSSTTPFTNPSGPCNSACIVAPLSYSTNTTSHHRHQKRHRTHSLGHPRGQGYFSGTSMNTSNASVAPPTRARCAVQHPCGADSTGGGSPQRHRRQRSSYTSGYHASSGTSARCSANKSPASSQFLPEAPQSVQPSSDCNGGAPRGWGSGGSEYAAVDSVVSGANGSLAQVPTATPVSQASLSRRQSMNSGGRAYHLPGSGNANHNFNHSFRSMYSAPRYSGHRGRHRGSGQLRRWLRRWRRHARRRTIASWRTVQLCVTLVWGAMRRGWCAFGGGCVRGWGWAIRQARKSASAASHRVVVSLRRPRWLWAKLSGVEAVHSSSSTAAAAAGASVPSAGAAREYPGVDSQGADAVAEAAAAAAAAAETAKRGGLLTTDTADEAINKIVHLLEPTPGRVPTVVVIRIPLGYDVSTDAASLWTALHLDSTSFEEGLVDIVIMEELKTGPLPPAQPKPAEAAAGPSSQVSSFTANRLAPSMQPCVGTGDRYGAATTFLASGSEGDVRMAPPSNPLSSTASVPGAPAASPQTPRSQPSKLAASSPSSAAAAAATTAKTQARLRISFEVYPAHLFYSLIFRAAVLQEKDLALRRAAAELFGGSDAIEGSGKGIGVGAAVNGTAGSTGGGVGATPCSPLSLARAMSFTFGMPATAGGGGECSSTSSGAMTHFTPHMHPPSTAAVVGSSGGFENYCLSPVSPGHFCRMQPSVKQTAPAPHTGIIGGGGGGGGGGAVAAAVFGSAAPGAVGGTFTSPAILPVSALSSLAGPNTPHVVVRLSESYSLPALPPQMVMSPLVGAQTGFRTSLGPLSPGVSAPAYAGGGGSFMNGGGGTTAAGAAATSSPPHRIISDDELLFYIHVLRATVGDGATTPALPSSRASDVDDNRGAESRDVLDSGGQRDDATAAEGSAPVPSGVGDADPAKGDMTGAAEDNNMDSEDVTLLDLRQREVEPHILLRYRFRVYKQGSRSRKALEAAVLYTQDRVELWYEEAKKMLQALPPTASFSTSSSLPTPPLRVDRSSPSLQPFDSCGQPASPGKSSEAAAGVAAVRRSRHVSSRPAGLPLLSLGASRLPSTPELDWADCHTTTSKSGRLQLPAWAMEVLIRRESMRETLVRDLKEKAFRVCAIPLPDMRVHCILPPVVPRYVTAHARGFPLSRTFAEEVLSQQRALQFILLQREQENQRAIAARLRREQRRRERRERRRRERRAREEALREAQQRRQHSKKQQQQQQQRRCSLAFWRGEPDDSARGEEQLPGSMNPATLVSRVASMVKHVSVGCGSHSCNVLSNACTKIDSLYQREGQEAVLPGEPSIYTHSPHPPMQPYQHGCSAANGGLDGASSPDGDQSAATETSAPVGAVLSEDERERFHLCKEGCGDALTAATPAIDSTPQLQRPNHQLSSPTHVGVAQTPLEQQARHAPSALATGTLEGIPSTSVETEIHFLDSRSASVSEALSDVPLTAKTVGASVLFSIEGAKPKSSRHDLAGDKGGSGRGSALALSQPPALALAKGGSNSPLPQPRTSPGPHSDRGACGSTTRPVPLASGASTRSSHWTAVHTATNANTNVTTQQASSATTTSVGSPAAHVISGSSDASHAVSTISLSHTHIASPSTGSSAHSHLNAWPVVTSSALNGASSTAAGFGGAHAASVSSHNSSTVERGPQGTPPPPPPVSGASSLSLGTGIAPSWCVPSPPDTPMANRTATNNASLDVTSGGHSLHQGTDVLHTSQKQQQRQQQPPPPEFSTGNPYRSAQNPALPASVTALLNVEDTGTSMANICATQNTGSHTNSSGASSPHNHSQLLGDDGGLPTASLTVAPLTVPNNSMYGTFDAYYGHSVATPQAVLLRQQTQVAIAAPRATSASSMRELTSPRHRTAADTVASLAASTSLVAGNDTGKNEPHLGGFAGDHDAKSLACTRSNAVPAAAAAVVVVGGNTQHLQAPRSAPRRSGSGLLPYTYSADSVSSMYGTTQYPLYQYPDDPNGAGAMTCSGASPPPTSMPGATALNGGGGISAAAVAGCNHANAVGTHTHNFSGYSGHTLPRGYLTGGTQAYAPPGTGMAFVGSGVGDRYAASSVDGGDGRLENWSAHSLSPRLLDSPGEMNSGAIASPPLPLGQDTHMNHLKQYNKLLSDLLGVAGGPMRSGISFYYTFGDATALLYNGSIRAPRDENIMELLDQHQWMKQQHLQRHLHTGGVESAGTDSGVSTDGKASGSDKIASDTSCGSCFMPGSVTAGSGAARVLGALAGIGASPPPPPPPLQQHTSIYGSGSAVEGDAKAHDPRVQKSHAAFSPVHTPSGFEPEDEGCSYLDYGNLAELQGTVDALETEQIEAQRARNTHFYSIFEHLHHVYHDTVLEATAPDSAKSLCASPATAAPSTSTLYTGLSGGVGTEYLFPAAAAAAAERHTPASHGVGHTTLLTPGTPPLGVPCSGKGAVSSAGLSQWPRRLWGRVRVLVTWVGSLVGLARAPRDIRTTEAVGAPITDEAPRSGACAYLHSYKRTPDGENGAIGPAKLAECFPGERIVTFGDEWSIASSLDVHNGHFGLSPLQVWMATRYSRRFAGEVYLMDVIAAGSDPHYPAVRVLDEVVAHAVLYYHNHSLRDFVEDLEAELGLVYVPQTLWGRRALGLPDDEDEVQELDGLLYTATRRRQRAQEKNRQRQRRSEDTRSGFENVRAVSPRSPPRSDEPRRSSKASAPPSKFLASAAEVACDGETARGWPAGRHPDRHRSSSLHSTITTTNDDTAAQSTSGADAVTDLSSATLTVAARPSNRPLAPQQHHRPRRHHNDCLEDEETAEYAWIQLQAQDQEEDEEVFYGATAAAAAGLGGGDINIAPHVYDAVMEREVYDERMLLRELDYLKEFFVDNRNVLSSAMLTTAGSNSLEAVFGVPATVFPFLLCARESVPFVASIFESLSHHYGALTYDNFSKYVYDVYHRDRPDVLRYTPRMFRMVNKSRRGCITYEELCRWMARKLSCGNNVQPNGHLVATSMSLRLPLALVAESRDEWDAYRCVLKSLSDGDDEEY
ncbi:hypothetical protein JKF63_07153 [Porcisia hertigi]|uniref:Uncharacterized protein n=1 Tax=Porcisia hertigi TaxID=2761500 RepID=A0A836LKF4_9TRYP|nr:hypothetical protein JKF63_07153 [Porcisia hertigi]